MSDLMPMYARLRGTLAHDRPAAAATCPHRRRDEMITETSEADPADARLSLITTEVKCGACGELTGRTQRREVRR